MEDWAPDLLMQLYSHLWSNFLVNIHGSLQDKRASAYRTPRNNVPTSPDYSTMCS